MVERNLPGVIWIHALVRSVAGWWPVALRGFDVFVVLGISLLLSHFVEAPLSEPRQKSGVRGVLVCGVLLFYFGTSEWCHCQRDTWMLLPCLDDEQRMLVRAG